MSDFLNVTQVKCANRRIISFGLKMDDQNRPLYLRIRCKKDGERPETIIVPMSKLKEFERALSQAKKHVIDFSINSVAR